MRVAELQAAGFVPRLASFGLGHAALTFLMRGCGFAHMPSRQLPLLQSTARLLFHISYV